MIHHQEFNFLTGLFVYLKLMSLLLILLICGLLKYYIPKYFYLQNEAVHQNVTTEFDITLTNTFSVLLSSTPWQLSLTSADFPTPPDPSTTSLYSRMVGNFTGQHKGLWKEGERMRK